MVKYLLLFPYFFHLFSFHVSQTSTSIMFPWWNWDVDEMLEALEAWHQHHQHEMHARNKAAADKHWQRFVGCWLWAVDWAVHSFIAGTRSVAVVCNAGITCHVQSTIEDSPTTRSPKKLATASPLFTCSASEGLEQFCGGKRLRSKLLEIWGSNTEEFGATSNNIYIMTCYARCATR